MTPLQEALILLRGAVGGLEEAWLDYRQCKAVLEELEARLVALETLVKQVTPTFHVLPFAEWTRLRMAWEAADAVALRARAGR